MVPFCVTLCLTLTIATVTRAHMRKSNTSSYVNHKTINSWIYFFSYKYDALLGCTSIHRAPLLMFGVEDS